MSKGFFRPKNKKIKINIGVYIAIILLLISIIGKALNWNGLFQFCASESYINYISVEFELEQACKLGRYDRKK